MGWMSENKKELDFVDGDDWVALYINGAEFYQGHGLDTHDWMEAAAGCTTSRFYSLTELGTDRLFADGCFPSRWDEIPEEWLKAPDVFPRNLERGEEL
jgi:hypothetical protein